MTYLNNLSTHSGSHLEATQLAHGDQPATNDNGFKRLALFHTDSYLFFPPDYTKPVVSECFRNHFIESDKVGKVSVSVVASLVSSQSAWDKFDPCFTSASFCENCRAPRISQVQAFATWPLCFPMFPSICSQVLPDPALVPP